MSQIDSTGFTITSLSDRLFALITAMQLIFGSNINVDPNSYDGQTLGIFAEAINNLDQLAQAVYNCFNPNTATGAALSTLVQLNYITRQQGAYSTVSLLLDGAVGVKVPAGTLFASEDGSGNQWQTTANVTIPQSGSIVAQAQATVYGALTATIGTITGQLTPIYNLNSVTNNTAAIPGNLEETDAQLRARRALSVSANGQGPVDALRGAIMNLPGVTQCEVYENYEQAPNTNGQPGNSIYAVVVGGADQDIWNTLWFKRSAAVKPVGTVQGQVIDTRGWPHTMAFDRPTQTPVYIIANIKKRSNFPANGATLIATALVAWQQANLSIGDPVIQSELYAPLMESISNTGSILSLYIGLAANPNATADLTIPYNGIAEFDPSFITVNLS